MTNEEIEDLIFEKYKNIKDITKVPEPYRTVIAIYSAQGIIDHGGLGYFFESDFPSEDAYDVICSSYCNVGLTEKADALRKVLSLFPDSKPHKNHQKREVFLSKYFDYGNLHPTVKWAEEILDGGTGDPFGRAINYFKKNT